jgi:hypothetical protein
MLRIAETEAFKFGGHQVPAHVFPGPRQAVSYQAIKMPIAAVREPVISRRSCLLAQLFDAT